MVHFVSSTVMSFFMHIYKIVFESDSRLARTEKSCFNDYVALIIPRTNFLDAEKPRKVQRSGEIRKWNKTNESDRLWIFMI
jgi:hypothetical protein